MKKYKYRPNKSIVNEYYRLRINELLQHLKLSFKEKSE